jgi:GTP-binding protein HflX
LFERHAGGERAALVHVDFKTAHGDEDLQEFTDLVDSTGAGRVALFSASRAAPDPRYFVGSGKAQELRDQVAAQDAELVIFNHALSPSQVRNLERLCRCRVIDRSELILDIFAQRARSHEGKLQVELAQLRYMSTRLVRGWTHLERQKGGIGLRGPGETQLETDRRLIAGRIKQISQRLARVRSQRKQSRQARRRAAVPTVSLVGYTNAGKSTLFNRLTDAGVYEADQLFATLDPTLRRYRLTRTGHVVLADTVGFIRQLPHELVAAFHATLQETRESDLLLHIIDVNADNRQARVAQVEQVLAQLGAQDVPQIQIYNKIDLGGQAPRMERDPGRPVTRVWLSAQSGAGLDLLHEALTEYFRPDSVHGWLNLPPQAGRLRARLFEAGAVLQERVDEYGAWQMEVELPRQHFKAISRLEDLSGYALKN